MNVSLCTVSICTCNIQQTSNNQSVRFRIQYTPLAERAEIKLSEANTKPDSRFCKNPVFGSDRRMQETTELLTKQTLAILAGMQVREDSKNIPGEKRVCSVQP